MTTEPKYYGLGLRWDHCEAQGTGAINRNFACNTNSGFHRLVGSFNIGSSPMSNVSGTEMGISARRVLLTMESVSGNIWMLENVDKQGSRLESPTGQCLTGP